MMLHDDHDHDDQYDDHDKLVVVVFDKSILSNCIRRVPFAQLTFKVDCDPDDHDVFGIGGGNEKFILHALHKDESGDGS